MQPEAVIVPVELREASGDTPARLVGTLLPIGRVAIDRREVFVPGSVQFPAAGVRLLLEHRGREVMRFTPIEDATAGEWRIDAALPDTPKAARLRRLSSPGNARGSLSSSSPWLTSASQMSARSDRRLWTRPRSAERAATTKRASSCARNRCRCGCNRDRGAGRVDRLR